MWVCGCGCVGVASVTKSAGAMTKRLKAFAEVGGVKGQQVSAEELCRGVKQPTTLSPVAESRAGLSARTACCCALLLSLLAPGLFLTSEEEAGTVKDTGDDGVYAIREKPLRTYSSLFSQWVSRPDAYHIGLASGSGTAVHAGSQGVGRSRWSEAR